MNIENINGYTLNNLNRINIILGKNGCGKSTLFRLIEAEITNNVEVYGKTKYITPERSGSLTYEAGVDQNMSNDTKYLPNSRRKNQTINFRQQSVSQYMKLENLVLREIESKRRGEIDYTFDLYVNKINTLLDNIEIKRDVGTFKIYQKGTNVESEAEIISSGESELISLGIECLVFSRETVADKENILFLDEPDVHLHPDLQVRLMHFLRDLVSEGNFKVIMATHSTAVLGAFESYADTHLAFLVSGQKEINFKSISDSYRKILPVFGAHPLSNIFNQSPVLLLEGDDDERIWQQAVRSAGGRLKLYPCSVEGVDSMPVYEIETEEILNTVYEGAKGFSLRDSDGNNAEIDDMLHLTRMKLSCRNAENLLLTDEVLISLGTTWVDLQTGIESWLTNNDTHGHFYIMNNFKENNYDRINFDLKEIRNDLMGIIGSAKPWEVAVGQAIALLKWDDATNFAQANKMITLLGKKVVTNLIPKGI